MRCLLRSDSPLMLPADFEMDLPWSRSGCLGVIEDWVASGLLDRRMFLAVSGTALTAIAASYPSTQSGELALALDRGGGGNPLVEQIEQSIPLLQRLDDAHGRGAHLPYVGAQFRAVSLLLHQGGHRAPIERRLFAALAELGQLAGWMGFDAGQHGLAQRYYFTALRAADQAGYRAMAAHILADLSFQAASREQPGDAVELGEAACATAQRTSTGVRASVLTRLGYAYAVAGQLGDANNAYHAAVQSLADGTGQDPPWMYYLTPNHLDTQRGYALAHAGVRAIAAGDRATAKPLLREGERLLRTGAHSSPLDDPAQRRALFEGGWLAVTAAHRGDLDYTCNVGRTAVARTVSVHSARSAQVLALLAVRLRRSGRNETVRDFLPTLQAALTRQPATSG